MQGWPSLRRRIKAYASGLKYDAIGAFYKKEVLAGSEKTKIMLSGRWLPPEIDPVAEYKLAK